MVDAIDQQRAPKTLNGAIPGAGPEHVLAAERWLQGQY